MTTKNQVLARLEKERGSLISGSELAKALGVSRNAVWKAIKELQKEGYRIDSQTNGGYRLREDNDILSAAGIAPYLQVDIAPTNIQVFPSLNSTNDLAKEKALAGAAAGTVILAEEQTKGKGRMGRSYYSPAGAGIYLSMILRPKLAGSQALLLTTGVAVAAAQAIEELWDCRVKVKWVNDLYVEGKKIAGILTEAATNWETGIVDHVVLGVGINVRSSREGFPMELAHKAGFLCPEEPAAADEDANPDQKQQPGGKLLRNPLAAALINHIWQMAKSLEEQPEPAAAELINEARRRSCVLGKQVLIEGYAGLDQAKAVDINEWGFLIVEDQQGCRHILNTGEISLRNQEGQSWQ
ncbi:MAG: biotin--[acetyl-CoA-carboxylase] ligase [Clostridiales bacterium]